jgi:hypothetical protein
MHASGKKNVNLKNMSCREVLQSLKLENFGQHYFSLREWSPYKKNHGKAKCMSKPVDAAWGQTDV